MKKIFILLIASIMLLPLRAQQLDTIPEAPEAAVVEEIEVPEISDVPDVLDVPELSELPAEGDTVNVMGKIEVIDTPENTRVTLGENEVLIVEENGDTMKVVLGSRGISIVEGKDGTEIKVLEMDNKSSKTQHPRKKKFCPHYAGLEVGMNNFLTPDFSLVLPPGEEFMDLNTGKSWNWNINVVDFGVGLGTSYVGLASGLGFEFINYNFDGQNSIMKDPVSGEIVEYAPSHAGFITKSKMNVSYLTAPLLLEFQIPTGRKGRIYISGGVLGSVKLWSNTKIKYTEAGDKSKEKNKSDFNLSPIRWGVTARAGYRNVGVFANYYMTSLFKTGRGPELYPFSLGLAFTF